MMERIYKKLSEPIALPTDEQAIESIKGKMRDSHIANPLDKPIKKTSFFIFAILMIAAGLGNVAMGRLRLLPTIFTVIPTAATLILYWKYNRVAKQHLGQVNPKLKITRNICEVLFLTDFLRWCIMLLFDLAYPGLSSIVLSIVSVLFTALVIIVTGMAIYVFQRKFTEYYSKYKKMPAIGLAIIGLSGILGVTISRMFRELITLNIVIILGAICVLAIAIVLGKNIVDYFQYDYLQGNLADD